MPKRIKNIKGGFNIKEYKVFPGNIRIHPNVEDQAKCLTDKGLIGEGTIIHDCKILGPVNIGKNCIVGNGTILEKGVILGDGTKVWHFSQIRNGATIGKDCVISGWVFIDAGVEIGNECKIQNLVSVYHGVTLGDGVFMGPNCRTTNDVWPRARMPGGGLRGEDDWELGTITIEDDASIGAGATLVANNITIGRAAMVGSGAVVTRDVKPYTIVVGVPAKSIGEVKDRKEYESK